MTTAQPMSRAPRVPLNRPLRALALAAAGALTLAACGSADAASPDAPAASAAAEDVTVTVGTLRGQPHLFHPFLYDEVLPEGLEVEVVLFDTSPDIKNAVVSGTIDFGVTGVPSALSGVAAGEDVVVVAAAADGGSGIVGDPSITSVQDLVGKTVGYPQGASQEILLRLTLEQNGVDIDDLTLVNLPFSDMANALASGQIDAFSSAELGPSIAQQAGAVPVVDPYETPVGKVNIGLVTTQRLIDADPELVQAVVDTHIQATEALVADTDAWVAGVVAEYGLDQAVVETAVTNIWPRWALEQEYQDQVVALAAQMNALGYLPEALSADQVVDTTFVDASPYAG